MLDFRMTFERFDTDFSSRADLAFYLIRYNQEKSKTHPTLHFVVYFAI